MQLGPWSMDQQALVLGQAQSFLRTYLMLGGLRPTQREISIEKRLGDLILYRANVEPEQFFGNREYTIK